MEQWAIIQTKSVVEHDVIQTKSVVEHDVIQSKSVVEHDVIQTKSVVEHDAIQTNPWWNTMSSKQNPWWNTMSRGMNEVNGAQHSIWMEPTNNNTDFLHFYHFPIIVLTTVPPLLYQLLYFKNSNYCIILSKWQQQQSYCLERYLAYDPVSIGRSSFGLSIWLWNSLYVCHIF